MSPPAPSVRRPFHACAHEWLRPALHSGAVAVDGTCGNGHDTLFLCHALAEEGYVLAIDKQEQALTQTRGRLLANNYRAKLVLGDHRHLARYLNEAGLSEIDAAIFNLGYLPGGDHRLTTLLHSTMDALRACLFCGTADFRLAVTAYRGHEGGSEEEEAVRAFMEQSARAGHVTVREETPGDGPVFHGLAKLHPESER